MTNPIPLKNKVVSIKCGKIFTQAWLTAKLIALLIYIILGEIALKHGTTQTIRATAFLLAIATFFYLVSVALTRSAIPISVLMIGDF